MNKLTLIIDVEATCWDQPLPSLNHSQVINEMEVIEFGCVVANLSGKVLSSRSFFVRPSVRPQLSDFCQRLTGISQTEIDNASGYKEVVRELDAWLSDFNIEFWASWGNYDKNQIQVELERHNVAPKFYELEHVNLKKLWRKGKRNKQSTALLGALEHEGFKFQGKQHRGIDDALNIARILPRIVWE